MLTLTEELFLLSLHEKKKSIEISNHSSLRYGLAGALLAELVQQERVVIDDEKRIVLIAASLTGNELLDKAIAALQESNKPHKLSYWLDHLSCGKKQQTKLIASLEAQGVLRQEEKRFLWVIPYTVYPEMDASAKYTLKEKLRSAVLANRPVDPRSLILLSLLKACKMLDHVFTIDEVKASRHKIEDMVKDEMVGSTVTEILQEIESGAIAAMLTISD